MIKKIIMGFIWVFVTSLILGAIMGMLAPIISLTMGNENVKPFVRTMSPLIPLFSLIIGIWGTVKGKFPGTKD